VVGVNVRHFGVDELVDEHDCLTLTLVQHDDVGTLNHRSKTNEPPHLIDQCKRGFIDSSTKSRVSHNTLFCLVVGVENAHRHRVAISICALTSRYERLARPSRAAVVRLTFRDQRHISTMSAIIHNKTKRRCECESTYTYLVGGVEHTAATAGAQFVDRATRERLERALRHKLRISIVCLCVSTVDGIVRFLFSNNIYDESKPK
jgi:hypothetical protein